jgi:hypothetical protein
MTMRLTLIVCLIFLAVFTKAGNSLNDNFKGEVYAAEQWRVVEISFASTKNYEHPFDGVELDAAFTGPGGIKIVRPAFWSGGNTWKVRFAPTVTGKWTMESSCSDKSNAKLHHVTAIVHCTAYTGNLAIYKHGFLKRSEDNRYFEYADGTPFFYLGDTHWIYIHERFNSSNKEGVASQFKYIADKRVEQGFTVYQTEAIQHTHGQNSKLGGGNHDGADEEPFCNLRDGVDGKDMPGFENIDRKFRYLADKGLVNANSAFIWAQDPAHYPIFTETYMAKLGRYWSARYGAYPVLWTIAQEIDKNMYKTYDSVTINKWFAAAEAIASSDDYHHPLTAHMENTSATVASDSWWDKKPYHNWWGIQWQDWLNADITKVAKDFWFHEPHKPSVLYESPYEDFWTDAKGARGVGYMSFQSGIYGYGYGANGVWNDLYSVSPPDYGTDYEMPVRYLNWYDGANLPGASQLIYLKNFYTSLAWWRLIPRFDDTSYAYFPDRSRSLLASDGQETCVVYFSNRVRATGTLKKLAADTYQAKWFNPRTGVYTEIGDIKPTNNEWTIPSKPDTEDWVLLLQKGGKHTLAGAIRWDAWIGDFGSGLVDAQSVGLQVERSLNPNKFHYRAPFYAKEISHDSIQIRGTTQAIMDQEIAYAKYAGIDYWAFCWYPPHSGLDTARQLYLASEHRNDVKWSVILGTNPFNYTRDGQWLVQRFKETNYQKVAGGRPLVYIFGNTKSVTRKQLDSLRMMAAEQGLPNPFVAVMEFNAPTASTMADSLGADALSSYISWTGKNGEPYEPVIPKADRDGWESYSKTGKQIIPWVTAGHNTEPRIIHPVSWYKVPDGDWVSDGTPAQIGQNLNNSLNWVRQHPGQTEANAIIIYAWNEHDEGGWICPTLGNNTTILEGVKTVLANR